MYNRICPIKLDIVWSYIEMGYVGMYVRTYVCICMYVCMYVCIYVCMYVYVSMCVQYVHIPYL